MPLPADPREGRQDRAVWFRYYGTNKGTSWHAWIAGPAYWCKVHQKGRTKPCLKNMTRGKLRCQRCEDGAVIDRVGYVPLYRAVDAKPVCVIVHEDVEEMVAALTLHRRVLVGREDGATDGVWITDAPKQVRYDTTLPERQRPADMTASCLRMWSIPELDAWYYSSEYAHGARPSMSDTPLTLTAVSESIDESDPGIQMLRQRMAGSVPVTTSDPPMLGETVAAAIRPPHKNGKPKT